MKRCSAARGRTVRRCLASGLLVAAGLMTITPVASADSPSAADVARAALAEGDGQTAAVAIHDGGLYDHPEILGEIILHAGKTATGRGLGHAFAVATAFGFTHGGVSMPTATQAYQAGTAIGVQEGVTPEEAATGADAVAQTYQAYLEQGTGL